MSKEEDKILDLLKNELAATMVVRDHLIKSAVFNPSHVYSHSEGSDETNPKHYYKDTNGNYVRYTNAPVGHKDYNKYGPDPTIHPSEPLFDKNPEYFSPDGRKLSRAPYPGVEVQWNPNYHPSDPANFYAGRWVNPESGDHEYTYLDSDLRQSQGLKAYVQNALLDSRLEAFRTYARSLFFSDQIKDHITGIILILVDQGRFRASEIAGLSAKDVQIVGDFIKIGHRIIIADEMFKQAIIALLMRADHNGPLFVIPKVNAECKLDPAYLRIVGPHYILRVLEVMGTPLEAFQTYHASNLYSLEMQRLLTVENVTYDVAHHYALLEISNEMGYNLSQAPDAEMILSQIEQVFVDPIVVSVVAANTKEQGLHEGIPSLAKTVYPSIPQVSTELVTRIPSETAFSKFLHSFPSHEYMGSSNPNGLNK